MGKAPHADLLVSKILQLTSSIKAPPAVVTGSRPSSGVSHTASGSASFGGIDYIHFSEKSIVPSPAAGAEVGATGAVMYEDSDEDFGAGSLSLSCAWDSAWPGSSTSGHPSQQGTCARSIPVATVVGTQAGRDSQNSCRSLEAEESAVDTARLTRAIQVQMLVCICGGRSLIQVARLF
jgi:hypothetical protein